MNTLPSQEPDHIGPHGRAWRCDLNAVLQKQLRQHGQAPPLELNVCGWLVWAPWSHPIWPCVVINCISLREIPGWPSAHISLPGATHELFVASIDPDATIRIDESPETLRPINFAGQFISASDDEARERIDRAVRDICAGTLNPDSDGRAQWTERFSGSNLKPGALEPDSASLLPDGTVLIKGTGGAMVRALKAAGEVAQTLSADEGKPQ